MMMLDLLAKALEVLRVGGQIVGAALDGAAERLDQIVSGDDRRPAAPEPLLQCPSQDGRLRTPLLERHSIQSRSDLVGQLTCNGGHTCRVIPKVALRNLPLGSTSPVFPKSFGLSAGLNLSSSCSSTARRQRRYPVHAGGGYRPSHRERSAAPETRAHPPTGAWSNQRRGRGSRRSG